MPSQTEIFHLSLVTMQSFVGPLFSKSVSMMRMVMTSIGLSLTCRKISTCLCVSKSKAIQSVSVPTQVMGSRKECLWPSTMSWVDGRNTPLVATSCSSIHFTNGSIRGLSLLSSASSSSRPSDSPPRLRTWPISETTTVLLLLGS